MFQCCSLIKGASLTSLLGSLKDISPLKKHFSFSCCQALIFWTTGCCEQYIQGQSYIVYLAYQVNFRDFQGTCSLSPCLCLSPHTRTYSIDNGSYYLYHMWICCRMSGDRYTWRGCQSWWSLFILYS